VEQNGGELKNGNGETLAVRKAQARAVVAGAA